MKRRLLSLLLILCLFFTMIPTAMAAEVPTEAQAYEAIIAMKEEYPEGMRWTNDDFYEWNGYSPQNGVYYSGGYGCAGFAFLLSDAAFGTLPSYFLEEVNIHTVRVGDYLRVNNDTHSVTVLEVHKNYIVIAEGNYNHSIHWGRIMSAEEVAAADYAISRYPEPTPLQITQQPVSVTVAKGETARVTVKATGDGLTYRWYFKNPGDKNYTYTDTFQGNTYSIPMNEARNGRKVLCRVYDCYGNVVQSDSATLSMQQTVKITQQPVSVTVAKGETARVTVKATGDGLTYRWYFKNPGSNDYVYTDTFQGNTYSIPMNEARNGRRVLCRVYDCYGNMEQSISVKLSMK